MVYLDDGTQASRGEYDRVIGEWIARGRSAAPPPAAKAKGDGLTVTELIDAIWTHAQTYYANLDGTPSGELDNFRLALRPLKRLYEPTPAVEFGPLRLKAVREEMLKPHTVTHPGRRRRGHCPGGRERTPIGRWRG